MLIHRSLLAALLAAGSLVPLSQPAQAQSHPEPSRVIDPMRDLEQSKHIILAEQLRVEHVREQREAARPDVVRPATGPVTSGFGARWGSAHGGIDIANAIGTPIVAAEDGVVIEAGPASGFGLWVKVRHDDGTVTVYGHMNEITTWEGQRVRAGQQIATIGERGYSTGPHLHFEVWQDGTTKIDPAPWLASRGVSL